jgi:hypothetical protein
MKINKIIIKPMKKLVYIEFYKKEMYTNIIIIVHGFSTTFKLFQFLFVYLFEMQVGSNSILCSEKLL